MFAQSVFFMSLNALLLRTVYENVHDFKMIQPFSEPKIYTGGVDISMWSKLSNEQKTTALSKEWYLYYSYRNPTTGKLKRQPNIKAGVNRYKTKRERLSFLKVMKESLLELLKAGFNPYNHDPELERKFFGSLESVELNSTNVVNSSKKTNIKEVEINPTTEIESISVMKALKLGLETKKRTLSSSTYGRYASRVNQFEKWLENEGLIEESIESVSKKTIIKYLNKVLETTSARNRNNVRGVLSSLFNTLEDNEIIEENFVRKINVLQAKASRNKTYTPQQQKEIYEYMEQHDSILLLFVQFVSYNFLRPIEVCRLRIEDIDVVDKKLYVRAKNKMVKIKIIPEILIECLPDLAEMNKKHFLFTPDKIGGAWDSEENNKRDYFSKRFKKVKDHFGLGKDYGLYSFRHTFITKLYRQIRKEYSQFEAKSRLMMITGHTTMIALNQYLRDIDAELPEDYSNLIKD
ncbi:tyrosine-type recombinase/integrase [Urechidicola vernalis]|uniref:Site-specific integrase n=1 Tax=Urechidicola vernalis TaxID=3075600 RepID=A0ABU2Y367_9FLAO|nr:site-specific integrase [Urechidicola sp. P050]MDT0552089.1 site-specific integrase [Urechidicola sp. P050]